MALPDRPLAYSSSNSNNKALLSIADFALVRILLPLYVYRYVTPVYTANPSPLPVLAGYCLHRHLRVC